MNFFFLAGYALEGHKRFVAKTLLAEYVHSVLAASSNGILLVLIWHITTKQQMQAMWIFLVLGVLLFVVQCAIAPHVVSKVSNMSYVLGIHLRKVLIERAGVVGFGFFGTQSPSNFADRLTDAIDSFEFVLSHSMSNLLAALIIPPSLIVLLACLDWKLALVFAALMLLACVFHYVAGQWLGRIDQATEKAQAHHRIGLLEMLDALVFIKSYGTKNFWEMRLLTRAKQIYNQQSRQEIVVQPITQITSLGLDIGFVCTLWIGSGYVFDEGTMLTQLAFALIGYRAIEPLKVLFFDWHSIRQSDWQLAPAKQLLVQVPFPLYTPYLFPKQYDISFAQVSFDYSQTQDSDLPRLFVLHGFDMHFAQGKFTALVGASGVGKTTIFQLAMRFWDVQRGSISIGGCDIRHIPQAKLHRLFSPVFQSPFLVDDTLIANVQLGNPQAKRTKIIEVLEKSGCLAMAEQLPHGIHTIIGPRGMNLSGGQQQLVAIARSMLKDAPIVLFDESTAALDPESANGVYKAIATLAEHKTLIVIAHNLRTIQTADTIAVVAGGKIAEQGTHQQLLAMKGLYASSWHIQQSAQGWRITL